MACLTIAGNAEEGNQFIPLKEQLSRHHPNTKIDLADAKYDELHNYQYTRTEGSIPLIDYNVRNEDVSLQALKLRGYDRNGWPFAPCGILCRPNGFDYQSQRATFTCQRQCVFSHESQLKEYSESCPFFINYHGFITHMSIKQHPRLITEIISPSRKLYELEAVEPLATKNSDPSDLLLKG